MAADYIEQIRSAQPSGPYRLLGWSVGGVIAHEIAVQLRAAGERVEALVLLDAYPSQVADADAEAAAEAAAADPTSVERWRAQEVARVAEEAREQVGAVLGGVTEQELAAYAGVFVNNMMLIGGHAPGRFDGEALLVVAAEGRADDAPDAAAWAPYIAGPIAAPRLALRHADMARPERLTEVWQAVSDWLATRG
jgi:thioesterase domain-containing protein